jgi:hypothetical protein
MKRVFSDLVEVGIGRRERQCHSMGKSTLATSLMLYFAEHSTEGDQCIYVETFACDTCSVISIAYHLVSSPCDALRAMRLVICNRHDRAD